MNHRIRKTVTLAGAPPALLDRRQNRPQRARIDSALDLLQVDTAGERLETLLYRVLNRLQRLHPDTPAPELEAAVRTALRRRQSRREPERARHGKQRAYLLHHG